MNNNTPPTTTGHMAHHLPAAKMEHTSDRSLKDKPKLIVVPKFRPGVLTPTVSTGKDKRDAKSVQKTRAEPICRSKPTPEKKDLGNSKVGACQSLSLNNPNLSAFPTGPFAIGVKRREGDLMVQGESQPAKRINLNSSTHPSSMGNAVDSGLFVPAPDVKSVQAVWQSIRHEVRAFDDTDSGKVVLSASNVANLLALVPGVHDMMHTVLQKEKTDVEPKSTPVASTASGVSAMSSKKQQDPLNATSRKDLESTTPLSGILTSQSTARDIVKVGGKSQAGHSVSSQHATSRDQPERNVETPCADFNNPSEARKLLADLKLHLNAPGARLLDKVTISKTNYTRLLRSSSAIVSVFLDKSGIAEQSSAPIEVANPCDDSSTWPTASFVIGAKRREQEQVGVHKIKVAKLMDSCGEDLRDEDLGMENATGYEQDYDDLKTAFDDMTITPEGKARAKEAFERLPPQLRVLYTTETLENIISYFDPWELLQVQQVCKPFKNCYEKSQKLQQKTYQKVRKCTDKAPTCGPAPAANVMYPFNFEVNPMLYDDRRDPMLSSMIGLGGPFPATTAMIDLELPEGVLNMTLIDPCAEPRYIDKGLGDFAKIRVQFDHANTWNTKHIGSWQNLYITDPGFPIIVEIASPKTTYTPKTKTSTTIYAFAPMKACTMGQVMEVAKGLQKLLRSKASRQSDSGIAGLTDYGVSLATSRLLLQPARWEMADPVTSMVVKTRRLN